MLWDLFLTFFKMGAVTFGGGYAMLPILQREVAENKKWSTEEELMDYFAIGQCTPGMIAVNVATFVGYKQKGFSGGLAATLGVITPSMLIITAIAIFLSSFAANPFVIHAFAGIRVCVSASTVRKALSEDDWETVYRMVPKSTLVYLKSPEGQAVIRKIKMAEAFKQMEAEEKAKAAEAKTEK